MKQFVADKWLLGSDIGDLAKSPLLSAQLMQLYEDDYIRAWDGLLADLTLRGAEQHPRLPRRCGDCSRRRPRRSNGC